MVFVQHILLFDNIKKVWRHFNFMTRFIFRSPRRSRGEFMPYPWRRRTDLVIYKQALLTLFLILENILLLLYRTDVNTTSYRTRIVYAYVQFVVLPVAKRFANAEGNRTDHQLRLNQTYFSI